MNVFIHQDASFRALKSCTSLCSGMGNRSYFSKTGRGSGFMLASTAPIFFCPTRFSFYNNGLFFKHVDEKEEYESTL